MTQDRQVSFNWEKDSYMGFIEKEYENSYLVQVADPSPIMVDRYTDRMIISKKECTLTKCN